MKEAVLVTSGDLRESANRVCWPVQKALEETLTACFAKEGVTLRRAFPVDSTRGRGFIFSQRMGMDIFGGIDPDANLVFATAAWQYTHHVLPGMRSHRGPILTIANWSGQWPGLVGLLNLNGSLVKAGIPFRTLWRRWELGVSTFPAVLFFIALFFIPRSPRWLMIRGSQLSQCHSCNGRRQQSFRKFTDDSRRCNKSSRDSDCHVRYRPSRQKEVAACRNGRANKMPFGDWIHVLYAPTPESACVVSDVVHCVLCHFPRSCGVGLYQRSISDSLAL